MADAAKEKVTPPFTAFNFRVELFLPGQADPLCSAAFAECDGLEMSMAPKTIREGGNNNRPIHLLGPVSYGQLSLKRGMTSSLDLWRWFEQVNSPGQRATRATGEVAMLAGDGAAEQVRFTLTGCLPIKVKAPALNAKDGIVAVEEMQIAYETLSIQPGS